MNNFNFIMAIVVMITSNSLYITNDKKNKNILIIIGILSIITFFIVTYFLVLAHDILALSLELKLSIGH